MTGKHSDYVSAALKTAAQLGNPIFDLVHATLGLCDEAAELAQAYLGSDNEKEELGDMLWFCALAGNVVLNEASIDVWPSGESNRTPCSRRIVMELACDAAGLIKKPFAYGGNRPVPYSEIAEKVKSIILCIEYLATESGWTLAEIQQANIAKLQARYKGGSFNSGNALNRDTDAELSALQNA